MKTIALKGAEFDVEKIVIYLEKYKSDLENFWNIRKDGINVSKISDYLENSEFEKLNRFEKEIYLKKIIKQKLDEKKEINYDAYKSLCLWIIKDWGGITSSNDDDTMKLVDDFLSVENENYDFTRIASTSKVASFLRPTEDIIYDSRVSYSLNWIILSEEAGNRFFPIPEGRNSKMTAFDMNVLIRLKNVNNYCSSQENSLENRLFIKNRDKNIYVKNKDAYYTLKRLVKEINIRLWKGDKEREDNLYYTEMLLFAIADREIYQDITKRVKIEIE